MSHVLHPNESMYPPKGFSITIKGRNFHINPKGGYRGQLQQVQALLHQNGEDQGSAMSMCVPHWCANRPNLCKGAKVVKAPSAQPSLTSKMLRAASGLIAAVSGNTNPRKTRKRGGCGSCGGGRVV